jgi:hypothetical protein
MIESIEIKGYRTFSDFSLNGLGRINLLVGKNNSGKTSLLEALALLWGGDDLSQLWQILARRGEHNVPENIPGRQIQQEVDVSHFFTGHRLAKGTAFSVKTTNQKPARSISYEVIEATPEESSPLFNFLAAQDPSGVGLGLKITATPSSTIPLIPLTRRGSLRNDVFNQAFSSLRANKPQDNSLQFITTDSLGVPQVQNLWNDIVLNPEEDKVIEALRFIDPEIERVAATTAPMWFGSPTRGGFLLRRKGEERVPIGSFGDGIWRMFSLAIALSRVKGGLLLIDEIDTGLHHTVMLQMWKFVSEVSKAFNIQVFATSHSWDCIYSLSKVCEDNNENEITIHRLEAGKRKSVPFSESEIRIAAERNIEIR